LTRVLLDQGLPRSAAKLLSAAGWDVAHVGDLGLSRAEDSRILERARQEERTCVTLDADFHALLATSEAKSPSVVRIRREGLNGKAICDLLLMLTRMQKWGNSYAVRLPKAVVQETGIREGEALQVEGVNRHIRLRRPAQRKYSLDELVAGIRRSNLHGEVEFGAPEGREAF